MKMDIVEVKVDSVEFTLIHNLPYEGMFSIETYITRWSKITKDFAPENFVRFFRKENTGYKIFTENQWENYLKNLSLKKKNKFVYGKQNKRILYNN